MTEPKAGERWEYTFRGVHEDRHFRADAPDTTRSYRTFAPQRLALAVSSRRLPDPEPKWEPGDVVTYTAHNGTPLTLIFTDDGWISSSNTKWRGSSIAAAWENSQITPKLRNGQPWKDGS